MAFLNPLGRKMTQWGAAILRLLRPSMGFRNTRPIRELVSVWGEQYYPVSKGSLTDWVLSVPNRLLNLGRKFRLSFKTVLMDPLMDAVSLVAFPMVAIFATVFSLDNIAAGKNPMTELGKFAGQTVLQLLMESIPKRGDHDNEVVLFDKTGIYREDRTKLKPGDATLLGDPTAFLNLVAGVSPQDPNATARLPIRIENQSQLLQNLPLANLAQVPSLNQLAQPITQSLYQVLPQNILPTPNLANTVSWLKRGVQKEYGQLANTSKQWLSESSLSQMTPFVPPPNTTAPLISASPVPYVAQAKVPNYTFEAPLSQSAYANLQWNNYGTYANQAFFPYNQF